MSLYSTVFFIAIAVYSTSANKIVSNGDPDGGAALYNRGSQLFGGAGSGFLGPFFQLFSNVSDEDRTAFFEIVKNENLTINEVKTQLNAWAATHGKTDILANLTATFEAKKAEFQTKIQEVIAKANLSTDATTVTTQIQTTLNNPTLTRKQIGEQIKQAFESASNDTKKELHEAFEPFIQAIKSKFGHFGGGFGQGGFGQGGFGQGGFGQGGFGQGGQGGFGGRFGGFGGNHGGQGGARRNDGNGRNNNQNTNGFNRQNFAVQGGQPGSSGIAIFIQPLDGQNQGQGQGRNQALVRPQFVPFNGASNTNQNTGSNRQSNPNQSRGNRHNNQNTNTNVEDVLV